LKVADDELVVLWHMMQPSIAAIVDN